MTVLIGKMEIIADVIRGRFLETFEWLMSGRHLAYSVIYDFLHRLSNEGVLDFKIMV